MVTGTDTAVLSSDKMSVTVTLNAPLKQYQTVQFETVKNGILSKDLLKGVPKYTGEVTVSDTTVPTVTDVTASGNKEIDVVFSEPVLMPAIGLLDGAGSEFKLDGQNLTNYGYTSPATVPASTTSGYANEIDLTFAVPLTAGSHTLTIPDGTSTQLADAAGFMVSTKTVTFTVDNVTGTPSITSITGDNNGTVKVTYDRAMADNAIDETLYTVNGTAATSASFVSGTGNKQVKLVFPTDTVAIGANVLVVNSDVEDQFGNAVGSDDLRMNFTAGEDTVKPTVSSVTVINNTTIRVKFSETVDYVFAENVANYSLKDSSATAVTVSSAVAVPTANTNSDTYNLTVAAMNGSNYTLKIKNVEDLAATPNVMDDYTATVTGSDTTDPTFVSAIQVDGSTTKVAVMFDEAMDVASLTNAANYAYIDLQATPVTHALPSGATLSAGDGNKSVLITFPSSYTVNGTATTAYTVKNIRVSNVKDAAGNTLDGIVATSSTIDAAASATAGQPTLVADSVTLSSDSSKVTAKVSFNQAVSTLNISDFAVGAAGSEVAPDSGYVSGKDVVLNFTDATKQAAIRAAGVDAQLVTVATTSTNSYGVPIAAIVAEQVYNDNLAPKILKTAGVPNITGTSGATSTVSVQFSEAVDQTILGLYANDFTFIQGGKVLTVTSVTAGVTPDTLVFNFAASAISTGDVIVKAKSTNDIKALEDQAGNQATFAPSTSDLNGYTISVL